MKSPDRRIILGTDWWTDCDDVAALRIVCNAIKAGRWMLCGVILNGCMSDSCTSLSNFLSAENISVPIGIDRRATDFGGKPPYQKRLAAMGLGTVRCNDDCEDAVHLYRRLLAAAPDHSVELVEIGYLQALADTLDSPPDDISPLSGMELIKQKVKFFWCMAGNWEKDEGRENNFARNARASDGAYRLLSRYPGAVCFLGYEVGLSVIAHPPKTDPLLCRAFADHGSPGGRSAWDPMLVALSAECPPGGSTFPTDTQLAQAGYTLIRGHASVTRETGVNRFAVSPDGMHGFVKKCRADDWFEQKIDAMLTSVSAPI